MVRVCEFNTDEALDKAMRLFWHKGCAETSVRDLAAHTGVAQSAAPAGNDSARERSFGRTGEHAHLCPSLDEALKGIQRLGVTAMTPRHFGPPNELPRTHSESL